MHAFIIDGGLAKSRAEFVQTKFDSHTELIHVVAEKTSITIKQIQDLRIPLSIASRLPRLVWVEEANLMTIPAQNALLKLLEEPSGNTTFYLTCQSSSMLLPTIRSRSSRKTLSLETTSQNTEVLSELKRIMSFSAGDRLADLGKMDRAEAIAWLTSIESALRTKLAGALPDKSLAMLAKIAKLVTLAHLQLTENCSVSLVLQTFYLKLPHTTTTK